MKQKDYSTKEEIKMSAILILFVFAYGTIGWMGYWQCKQENIKLNKQIKRFYEGPEKEVECGTISKRQQIYQKILLKAREIADTGIF